MHASRLTHRFRVPGRPSCIHRIHGRRRPSPSSTFDRLRRIARASIQATLLGTQLSRVTIRSTCRPSVACHRSHCCLLRARARSLAILRGIQSGSTYLVSTLMTPSPTRRQWTIPHPATGADTEHLDSILTLHHDSGHFLSFIPITGALPMCLHSPYYLPLLE